MDKSKILDSIKHFAESNAGRAPGRQAFERETGIKMSEWYPHHWLRWGDALIEAGLAPNKLQTAIDDDVLCEKLIQLTRELGHLPVEGELRIKAREDKSFPSHTVFSRLGGKQKRIDAVLLYCRQHPGHDDVLTFFESAVPAKEEGSKSESTNKIPKGFVYLMKSGRHYKIGRTNSVGTRERQLAIKIPIPPQTIHSIETDDPVGVEAYWHRRFDSKRGEGEWFDLNPEDIQAFKRWKRIV